jgi:hypothetical protein
MLVHHTLAGALPSSFDLSNPWAFLKQCDFEKEHVREVMEDG